MCGIVAAMKEESPVKGALGNLQWLTLAFVGGLIVIVLLLLWASNSNAAESSLGWGIPLGVLFLLTFVGSTLTALILGIAGCAPRARASAGAGAAPSCR